jgi:drug/metabolite transporter (DMT)-like permease
MLIRIAPALFVLLWSTGFIGTKFGAMGAEPLSFLVVRFTLVLSVLAVLGWGFASPRLSTQQRKHAFIVGMLVHGVYLSGITWALRAGMAANVSSLIVSLQPVLTAVLAGYVLGETVTGRHWLGLALGIAGSLMVIGPKLTAATDLGIAGATLAAAVASLFAITIGTIYQKRHASGIDILSGGLWQYLGAMTLVLPFALAFEHGRIDWSPTVIGALLWLVFVLSIGAMGLLMLLIRHGAISRTSALFYMVPGTTAVMAYVMFNEQLTPLQIAGLLTVSVAVLLIQPGRQPEQA